MPCASFEDLLLDYTELSAAERASVDKHVSGCADCREYLEATAQFDVELLELHAAVNLSPAFQKTVFARIEAETALSTPSMLPEVLDFIGWSAMIIAVVRLAPLLPHVWPEYNIVVALGATAAILAVVWAGVRSYADLNG